MGLLAPYKPYGELLREKGERSMGNNVKFRRGTMNDVV